MRCQRCRVQSKVLIKRSLRFVCKKCEAELVLQALYQREMRRRKVALVKDFWSEDIPLKKGSTVFHKTVKYGFSGIITSSKGEKYYM